MTPRLISIIGPPAVGKTTLAERLASALPARLIREDYAGNPFLAESYSGSAASEAMLPGQLYFLFSRVGQLAPAALADSELLVSDYGFCQDRIFARITLSDDDYRLYDNVASRCDSHVQPPVMVVHLTAGEESLLGRIARRGRHFEQTFDAAFISRLSDAYARAAEEACCSVIRVDCDNVDLRRNDAFAGFLSELKDLL